MIKSLLNVTPNARPTAEQILKMPAVLHKMEKLFPEETNIDNSHLLQTIKNMKDL